MVIQMGFLSKLKEKFTKKEEKISQEENISQEEIVKQEESLEVYDKGLSKTRHNFSSKLLDLTKRHNKIDEAYFEELEEILIYADIGVNTVMKFLEKLRKRVKEEKITSPAELKEISVDELFIIYVGGALLSTTLKRSETSPTVYLFVGVNGVGKTTTIAKIAAKEKKAGRRVLLIAGDTFRAGATEQLKEWADRLGVEFYGKEEGKDPSSVIYEGLEQALKDKVDTVLIDTAGRLQNKVNLMNELSKMNRVITKLISDAPHETLLVIDATTGQNGISQAKAFKEITNLTGLVLTKLDSTAKGGVVLAIKEELNLPVKFIGLGETENDLQEFDIEKYIYSLFKDFMEE